jgi:hypothetical protein
LDLNTPAPITTIWDIWEGVQYPIFGDLYFGSVTPEGDNTCGSITSDEVPRHSDLGGPIDDDPPALIVGDGIPKQLNAGILYGDSIA